jgi:lysophospholipase L1-like esterase
VQSVSFDQDTAMFAPSAQLAKQAGVYFPLPLTKRGYIPYIEPEDFDEGGGDDPCRPSDLTDKEIRNLDNALSGFRSLEGRLAPNAIRIDPEIAVQNAAVGGEVLGGVVRGAEAVGMPVLTLLEHLIYDPVDSWGAMLAAPEIGSQLDYVLTLKPTLVMTVDIGGNDVLPALSRFDAARIPSDEYWRDHYRELFSRLGAETYVFIADLPDITLLPDERIKRAEKIASGETTAAVDAKLEAIRARLDEVNEILAEEAASYPNVTIVPFTKLVDDMFETGLEAGGQQLSFDNFGGFISLDGLHLSKTGYGVLANLFIDSMNEKLGTEIPAIDIDALVESDPYSPANLAPYGLSVTACPTP